MAETKTIIIQTLKDSDKFYNIIDNNNVEWGIGKDKNPKLAAILSTAKTGDSVTGNPWTKDGKNYLFDPKEGGAAGGKTFAPKDHARESAYHAAAAAGSMMALQKEITVEKFVDIANGIHLWIMSKTSKS